MTKAKKVLSLVLAVVMVAAMFAFSASASADQNATLTVTPSATTAQIGDVITVTVALTTDYYAGPTSVPVYYNPAVFEFVAGSVVGTDIFGAGNTDVKNHNDAATGCLRVIFVPQGGTAASAQVLNGTLFTFQLKAIANGDSPVEVKAADQKTSTNVGGILYCGAYATSSVDSQVDMYDQTFAITNTTVTVGVAATPELQLSEYGASVGAVINRSLCTSDTDSNGNAFSGCVMGIDTLGTYTMDTLDSCLTTPAGRITINTDDTVGGCETTGAVIELRDENDEIIERYVFIYFGDVDTDGVIMSGDGTICADYEATYEGLDYEYLLLAADVDGDSMVMSGDGTILADYESTYDAEGSFFSSQDTLAAIYA